MSEEPEVLFERRGVAGIITLNRPKALNSLTLNMVRMIHPQLEAWAVDDAVEIVLIEGAGDRAFCAGGDIRALHDWGKAKDPLVIDFYREEYRLNTLIKRFPKPYVAILNGITMGGGVGLSVHGKYRLVTDKITFAMPETGIGLFPDVGGTYFLPRLFGETGMYIALTGARLKAADCVYAEMATEHVPEVSLGHIKQEICNGVRVERVIDAHAEDDRHPPLSDVIDQINQHFSKDSVADILASLDADGSDWATNTAATIRTKSPLSTLITFRQLREGAKLDFEDCMKLEFRLTNRFMEGADFFEGVRSTIIDKDQKPVWAHHSINDVSEDEIDAYFAPLGERELTFD